MAKKSIRKFIKTKRIGQWIRVNYRFTKRKIKRFLTGEGFRRSAGGSYAKRLYAVLAASVLIAAVLIGTAVYVRTTSGTEKLILNKLTYPDTYDSRIPYFRTLHYLGSSNHLCVTVKTTEIDNLKNRGVALENGGVNLKLTFKDGTGAELALTRRYRHDTFAAGKESTFIVTLPFGYSPFDIGETSLVITAGSDGGYDDWSCSWATVSFMLGGKRVLIARDNWEKPTVFGSGGDKVRSIELQDQRNENSTYQQYASLYQALQKLAQSGMTDFNDAQLKASALSSLNLPSATALYLDVETVSITRNDELKSALRDAAALPKNDDLNFNGTLYIDVTFSGKLEDGGYTRRYTADTPGKDDFEMSGSSTFRFEMPEGMCIFDIVDVRISTSDLDDAWAPRFVRLYIPLDYNKELELARLTDEGLAQRYDTPIFYRGYLDRPVALDLTAQNAVPEIEAQDIKEQFGHTLTGASYSLYFEEQSFYGRQVLFYDQMGKLYAPDPYGEDDDV